MGSPSEIYVDPAIAADSGAGTVGDPYGDLEYAIEQTTFDTTNGTRVNIKSGTDEVLAAELSVAMADTGTTAAWVPSTTAPAVFEGYASSAGDGDFAAGTGIGGISGGGSVSVINNAFLDFIWFRNLHLHNTGSNTICLLDDDCSWITCEIDNSTGRGLDFDNDGKVIGCHIHNIGLQGVVTLSCAQIYFNYLKNGTTNKFTNAIEFASNRCRAIGNILSLDGASKGIWLRNSNILVKGNSILSAAGTGVGIYNLNNFKSSLQIFDNLIEGFSGGGGIGIDHSNTDVKYFSRNNAFFNNETNEANKGDADWLMGDDNESLGATPFDKTGSDTFANRFAYFSPVNTGNVHGGAYVGVG